MTICCEQNVRDGVQADTNGSGTGSGTGLAAQVELDFESSVNSKLDDEAAPEHEEPRTTPAAAELEEVSTEAEQEEAVTKEEGAQKVLDTQVTQHRSSFRSSYT